MLEKAPALRSGGCAIVLWPNGTGILADLGVKIEDAGCASAPSTHTASGGGR